MLVPKSRLTQNPLKVITAQHILKPMSCALLCGECTSVHSHVCVYMCTGACEDQKSTLDVVPYITTLFFEEIFLWPGA